MAKNTSIALSEHFQDFIREQIASGEYETASEVVRDGLRLLESERQRRKALVRALIDGEKSGPPMKVKLDDELKRLKARARRG